MGAARRNRQHMVGWGLAWQHVVRKHLVRKHLVSADVVVSQSEVRPNPTDQADQNTADGFDASRRSRLKISALSFLLWSVALSAAFALSGAQQWGEPSRWNYWPILPVFAACFATAEIIVVHIHVSGEAQTISLLELPLALGLLFVQPSWLIGAHIVGAGLALAIHRHQSALKLAFNVGSLVAADVLAIGLFRTIVDDVHTVTTSSLVGGGLAVFAGSMLSLGLVYRVIS